MHDLKRIARRAMLARGLLPEFSAEAQAQAHGLSGPAEAARGAIADLRDLAWSSIDNDDSRDLDQIEVAEPLGSGAVKVSVAIADVDALVPVRTALDAHARHNTTSVYTAAQIFPMLPERLSTDLTSLGEGADRIAIVVGVTIAADGTVADFELKRAWVRNRAKLAYDALGAWLEGRGPAPARVAAVAGLAEQLRLQDAVAQRLKALRHLHGALTLDTLEGRAVFERGELTDLVPEPRNRARELIEDFMIAANTATARFLAQRGAPSMRRVLRTPARWERIVALAAALGTRLPAQPDGRALEGFLSARYRAEPARFADLSLGIVKLLGRGEYVAELPGESTPGHFGLAISDYTHSTAPNRRFPDLITQRLVKAALAGGPSPYGAEELRALAAHCTLQEDNAAHVEREVRKCAAALLLEPRIGTTFAAIVTGVNEQGTWVRIARPLAEGKLVRGFEHLDVGDALRVKLIHTDVERGHIDFARAPRD
ncbi:MAG TPA: RNB domain-containing ribonuclease [Steroidobacteraceae bacterium]|nr:RNB domain-containing ribonuclease [Steroidobacteraceae bacterium]